MSNQFSVMEFVFYFCKGDNVVLHPAKCCHEHHIHISIDTNATAASVDIQMYEGQIVRKNNLMLRTVNVYT